MFCTKQTASKGTAATKKNETMVCAEKTKYDVDINKNNSGNARKTKALFMCQNVLLLFFAAISILYYLLNWLLAVMEQLSFKVVRGAAQAHTLYKCVSQHSI